MIHLKPIGIENINDFAGTSYDKMSIKEKTDMISESISKKHSNQYFEFLVVYDNDAVVGFINLYAHSEHAISCAPEIKAEFQGKGFGYLAVTLALKYASEKGYTKAVADIEEKNTASITLHNKLGFKLERRYLSKNNRMFSFYTKQL